MKKTTTKTEIINAIEDIRIDYLFEGCAVIRERGVIIQSADTNGCISVKPHMEELCQLEDLGMTEHDSLEHLMYKMVYLPLVCMNKKSVSWKVFCECYEEAVANGVKCPPFQAFVDTMNSALAEVMCSIMDTHTKSPEAVN